MDRRMSDQLSLIQVVHDLEMALRDTDFRAAKEVIGEITLSDGQKAQVQLIVETDKKYFIDEITPIKKKKD